MSKSKKTASAFADLGDVLVGGFDPTMTDDENDVLLPLDQIVVDEQVRTVFEDEENTLLELGNSMLKHGQIQSILVRPIDGDSRYKLVCGERRYRAAMLVEMGQLRARIRPMSDDEATDVQLAENIQRKNLALFEEAKAIKADLAKRGSIEAVLAHHNKSRAWLSKMLSLLELPEQAKRLVDEKISADVEVINGVKVIEKVSPEKAKELVNDLKETRGKADARKKVEKVKSDVKPKKPKKEAQPDLPHVSEGSMGVSEGLKAIHDANQAQAEEAGTTIATAKDRSAEEPSEPVIFAPEKNDDAAYDVAAMYEDVAQGNLKPWQALEKLSDDAYSQFEAEMRQIYKAGMSPANPGRDVLRGLRNGTFAQQGEGAFALAAFLYGVKDANFSLQEIVAAIKT